MDFGSDSNSVLRPTRLAHAIGLAGLMSLADPHATPSASRRWPSKTSAATGAFVLIAALVGLAAWNRFIQDDAWISFRYTAHLLDGLGPVFNPGERVEGYTNFLWVLLMSVPMALGLDPVPASQVLGLGFFAGTLGFTYACASRMLESETLALLCVGLVGTNYSFSAYATGGLETQLQAFLVAGGLWFTLDALRTSYPQRRALLGLALFFSLAMWTRLDSLILFAIPYTLVGLKILRANKAGATRSLGLVLLCLPPLVLVGGWLGWKLAYYGNLLPNTFYAKAAFVAPLERGLFYVYRFTTAYGLLPFIALALLSLRGDRVRLVERSVLAGILALWTLYVVGVGGGFMEFRLVVPAIPLLYVLIVDGLRSFDRPALVWLFALVCTIFSLHHSLTFWHERGIESVRKLEHHVTGPSEDWVGVGRALADLFPRPSQVRIAVTAAGALPFYSGLETVDMLGLNDAWVARHGLVQGTRPGHQRVAPLGYLVRRGVHLVVGHPWMIERGGEGPDVFTVETLGQLDVPILPGTRVPGVAKMVEIPVNSEYDVVVLYLTPHPEVDRAIDRAGLRTFPIAPRAP